MIAYYQTTDEIVVLGEASSFEEACSLYRDRVPKTAAFCFGKIVPDYQIWKSVRRPHTKDEWMHLIFPRSGGLASPIRQDERQHEQRQEQALCENEPPCGS